jgi:hypothetical protein
MVRLSDQARMAAGSVAIYGSAMVEFMECLSQHSMIFVNKVFNFTKIVARYPAIADKQYVGGEPEFAFTFWSPHMHMSRFISFVRIEMKPEGTYAQNGGHVFPANVGVI